MRVLGPARGRTGGLVGEGSPAPIRHAGRGPAVLALHGFAGAPREVALVTDAAAKVGLAAYAPLLPGHGTHARELQLETFESWTAAALAALDELSAGGASVVVAGISLGSVLATHLAVLRPRQVAALVVLASAVRLNPVFPGLPLAALERTPLRAADLYVPKAGADIRDAVAARTHLTYDLQPVRAAIEVVRAGRIVRGELALVRCPTFVAHGALDRVCPVGNATHLARHVGTEDVELLILPRSAHIVTEDVERELLAARLERFLRRVAPEATA